MTETTRPTTVRVIADHTPGAHRTDSEDLWWWLPIIGPTAGVLAFLLARHAATGETCWPTDDLARMVGLAGNRSKLWLSLDRLHRFRVATFVSTDTLTIRLWLPALSDRQLAHLPASMAAAYRPARRHRLTNHRPGVAGAIRPPRGERGPPLPPRRGGCGGCVGAPVRSSPLAALGAEPFGLTGRSPPTRPL